jgi:YfiH family protein
MPFQFNQEICYYRFEDLGDDLIQAVFTRRGGLSPIPWASLNMGGTVGDDPVRVQSNRRLALEAIGVDLDSVYDVWQVHGVNVAVALSPRLPDEPHLQADVILTDKPGITLMMRFADCVPILLHDPVRKVIGLVHAGWMGTVRGVVLTAVEAMKTNFGTNAANIRAAIGPSIGPDHYQVGQDVTAQVRRVFGADSSQLLGVENGMFYLDLWLANRFELENAGVRQIEVSGICTACNNSDWFSHRAEHGRTGRFGAFIAMKS